MLDDNTQGVHWLGADAKLTLLRNSGTRTDLGTINRFGADLGGSDGVSLNNKGQIALPFEIDNGPDAIVLLTPTTP